MRTLKALLAAVLLAAVPAFAQHINLTWTSPGAATTVGQTSGVQTSGPITSTVYRAAATITSGVASCASFSVGTSAYTQIGTVAVTSAAANAGTFSDSAPTVAAVYCYAVTDTFTAGGAASSATVSAPILNLVFGTPAAPTSLTVTAGP